MINASCGGLYVLNDNIERSIKAAFRAGINAGGDWRSVEFVSTRYATTMNARMKLRQFALGTIRVACHLSLVSFQCYASAASCIAFDAESRNLKRDRTDFSCLKGRYRKRFATCFLWI
jgi:hypothetical protein